MVKNWIEKKVSEIAPLQRGFDLPASQIEQGEFPIVYSNGIGGNHKYAMAKGPGVVTGRSGTIGTLTFVNKDYYPHNTTLWVTNFNGNDEKFIYYLYHLIDWQRYATGSGVPTLNRNDIHELRLRLPTDRIEQRTIATALSDTDAYIASLEKLITKKRAIKQGTMQQLLTGKRRLPGFSGKWAEKPLKEVALNICTGKKNNEDKTINGKYPFFVRSQKVETINSYSYDGEAIIVPGEGNIGKIYHYIVGKFDYHQRVYKISDFAPNYSGKYVYYQMQMSFGKHALENTSKATVDSLRLPVFQEYIVKIPPTKSEQTAIATVLSDMDAEIDALTAKLNKAKHIKQGMMSELLTGRIRLIQEETDNG